MKVHYLKTWPHYFEDVRIGIKTHEFRKDDRDYQSGDILVLQEYDPFRKLLTGRTVEVRVTHILRIKDMEANLKTVMELNPCSGALNQMAILSIRHLYDDERPSNRAEG